MSLAATTTPPLIVAIVNLSPDSFSDGGLYADPSRAEQRAREMLACGADWIELGAASSHPDAATVADEDEIERLDVVLDRLEDLLPRIAVDTWKPAVQRHCLARQVAALNDVNGFGDTEIHAELAHAKCRLVVMHRVGAGGRAAKSSTAAQMPSLEAIVRFLRERTEALQAAGVARERILVDPGMGLFLSDEPGPSLTVLARIDRLREALQLPVMISVSRKSFLGAISGRAVDARGAATLAAELYAVERGVDAVRTHDVGALVDALAVRRALAEATDASPRSPHD